MRSDSGQGFTAIVGPPDRPITVEQDDEYPLDVSFVAEYGSGGYAERLRFSNPLTGLCIQAVLPFEDDYGQYEPLVGFFCNDEEPLQASSKWSRWNCVALNLMLTFLVLHNLRLSPHCGWVNS